MTSGTGDGNSKKPEDKPSFYRDRRIFVDRIKEDRVRKELYYNEWKAEENWEKKWGFLKNPKKLREKEAEKKGLPSDIFVRNKQKNQTTSNYADRISEFKLVPSKGLPKISSEIIGWRLFAAENNINWLAGPMYVSRKTTMNPPLGPNEPDPNAQRVIFLG